MDMSMEGAMKMIISSESELSTGYRPYERTYDFMGRLEHASEFFRNVLATSPKGFHMYGDADNYMVIPKHEAVFNKNIKPLIGDDIVATLAKDLERTIASQNRNQFVPVSVAADYMAQVCIACPSMMTEFSQAGGQTRGQLMRADCY